MFLFSTVLVASGRDICLLRQEFASVDNEAERLLLASSPERRSIDSSFALRMQGRIYFFQRSTL
tara:strand:+ start:14518 stop:14709 length:192 start_codon:yes stop_codon:yes gene_type:complete